MEYDAFMGGVELGGLRSRQEIQLLLCYLLSSVGEPLSKGDILQILQQQEIANYFEAADALEQVLQKGNADTVEGQPDLCIANDNTRNISSELFSALPPVVREKAVQSALSLLSYAKAQREHPAEMHKQPDGGYQVTCHISDGSKDLLCFTLYAPDLYQARVIKKQFHRNPEGVYQTLLALLTGEKDG